MTAPDISFAEMDVGTFAAYLRRIASKYLTWQNDILAVEAAADRLESLSADPRAAGSVSERALIEARREGYVRGAIAFDVSDNLLSTIERRALKAYPFPKVSRPRVVVGGVLLYSHRNGPLCESRMFGYAITQQRVELWADLLAKPNELVEDTP